MFSLRFSAVAAATLAAACAWTATADARTNGCSTTGYSYAGIQTQQAQRGLAATITPLRKWTVTSGHIAAWVGVGGAGQGAGGVDEWLQIGVSVLPGGTSEIYYEVTLPGHDPAYTSVEPVTQDESHRVAVVELSPNVWAVRLDGSQVSPSFTLPGSHGNWAPMATSESYDGGFTSCNAYSFRLDSISYSTQPGAWFPVARVHEFTSGGHTLSALTAGAIVVNRH